jgi:hypothetical protein
MGIIGSRYLLGVAALLVLGLGGCGPEQRPSSTAGGTPPAKDMLMDLADLLRSVATDKRLPPARPADVAAFDGPYPAASAGLVNGEIVYVWGAGLGGDATKVLAWEKKADKEGGWVLMQDGTVKQMTADELKNAPRAKK